jgi:hypothetical protein
VREILEVVFIVLCKGGGMNRARSLPQKPTSFFLSPQAGQQLWSGAIEWPHLGQFISILQGKV